MFKFFLLLQCSHLIFYLEIMSDYVDWVARQAKYLPMIGLILLDSHIPIKLEAINFDFNYGLLRCQIEIYKIFSPQSPISLLIFLHQNVDPPSCQWLKTSTLDTRNIAAAKPLN